MKQFFFTLLRRVTALFFGSGISRLPGVVPVYFEVYRRLNPNQLILAEIQGSRMYVDSRDTVIAHALLTVGFMELSETEFLKKNLKPGMVFVDVGANIGYFTLLAARLVGERGKVYAFEPAPDTFALLVKSIELNHYQNIVPIQKAVSNQAGQTLVYQEQATSGGTSLASNNLQELAGSVPVETITLNQFFTNGASGTRVDILKMDIQGAEALAMEGATDLLAQDHLQILIEFWPYGLRNLHSDPVELLRRFHEAGFKLIIMGEYGLRWTRTQHDPARTTEVELAPDEFDTLVAECENKSNCDGKAFVNLYLVK